MVRRRDQHGRRIYWLFGQCQYDAHRGIALPQLTLILAALVFRCSPPVVYRPAPIVDCSFTIVEASRNCVSDERLHLAIHAHQVTVPLPPPKPLTRLDSTDLVCPRATS